MKYCNIGGQAILEGVMMKGPDSYAIAVRKPDNEIQVDVTKYKSFGEAHKAAKIPIVRGVVNFIESLYIGMKTLMASAEYFEDEEEDDSKSGKSKSGDSSNKTDSTNKDKDDKESAGDKLYMVGTLILSIAFAIGLLHSSFNFIIVKASIWPVFEKKRLHSRGSAHTHSCLRRTFHP